MKRIQSIDFTRGLVMIIMALDHVRDMIHVDAISHSPTDLSTTTPVLFFTRWITYLCAPTFVFLAGASVYLSSKKRNDAGATSAFLLQRGLFLLILEFAIVNFGLFFDPGYHTLIFEVIAAIGVGFINLALLQRLSPKAIGILGLVIICCHNIFPLLPMADTSVLKRILSPLFLQSAYPYSRGVFIVGYPPIPWLGIMLAGFGAGHLFEGSVVRVKRAFTIAGLASILLFVTLRYINIYGDALLWSYQRSSTFTFLSFMNVTKYPPSLLFCLITLGIMFLIVAAASGHDNKLIRFVSVYGKVPMFYFLLHFFLIHFILLGILLLQGFHWSQLEFATGTFGRPSGSPSGLSLPLVYLIWLGVVLVLYKPCQWFGNYKASHSQWWLRYL